MNKRIIKGFNELKEEALTVQATKHSSQGVWGEIYYIDKTLFQKWKVKVKNLLVLGCGKDSEYIKEFEKKETTNVAMATNNDIFQNLIGVFSAAKEDYEAGYVTSIRTLIQAEVFESELEQAQELLKNNYRVAAGVIAGIVLETGLRELCDRESIPHGKLDKMNAELAKKGIYSKLQQKRITALADIRNNAAHGKPENFTDEDVEMMIRDIESFLLNYLES